MITPKENYLRLSRGEIPEYLPNAAPAGSAPSVAAVGPADLFLRRGAMAFGVGHQVDPPLREYTDLWGVPFVTNHETGFAAIPKPGVFILDDITHWDKVIKHPEIPDNIDWEALAREEAGHVDRSQTAVNALFCIQTPFQQLVAFMGFTEGLCAIFEEPEAVQELVNYITDYYIPIIENTVKYFKPDILTLSDDTASRKGPFFSMEDYHKIFLPAYKRFAKPGTDEGLPLSFHNCGRCEDQLDDLFELGVRYWNPAEAVNDLLKVKEKFNNRMVISGGWAFTPTPETTEEEVRAKVRETIDRLAPGGGYIFGGAVLADAMNPDQARTLNGWIMDEGRKYGADFYKKSSMA